ncbi:MAG: hypothetical protein QNJ51_14955 [Calothrix sp. MO_167.B12]|nr:hypothetical protein [Calothrix sp. MO_167.B12]
MLNSFSAITTLSTISRILRKSAVVIALAIVTLPFTSQAARAETWIARCKDLQFNFNRDSKSYLVYFKTNTGIYQVARGKIIFDNGISIRGPIYGNGVGQDGQPITQIGLNRSRRTVWVLWNHPRENQQKSGTFCDTGIQIR